MRTRIESTRKELHKAVDKWYDSAGEGDRLQMTLKQSGEDCEDERYKLVIVESTSVQRVCK